MPPHRSLLPLAEFDWSSAAPLAAELGIERLLASQYYELRLGTRSRPIDYLAAFKRSRAAALRDAVANTMVRRVEYRTSAWQAIQRLLCAWADGESLSARRCPALWFEFDDYARQPSGAAPSISVCITQNYRVDLPHPPQQGEDLLLSHEALDLMGASSTNRDRLATAFRELPSGARWIHLSYMLGRTPHAIKLYGVMPRGKLMSYLNRIGWAGSAAAVQAALSQLYPARLLGDELYVDLNLENSLDPERATLGLAVAQQHLENGPDRDPTRSEVLAGWLKAGLCDFAKVDLARAWAESDWNAPQSLFVREQRYLDLKLVWQPSTGWDAKCYLGRHQQRGFF